MARKIRFSLKLKDGTEARTIEELQAHFDLESVLGYFLDGRLYTWLADRYYDDKAEAVNALSKDMPDLNQKLCKIFGVEYHDDNTEDLEVIQRRKEKLDILNSVTDNKEILDNVDFVAMNQDELFDILDESPEKIYLYGEKFSIPFGKENITYIGIGNPFVSLERSALDYLLKNIRFEKICFDEKSYKYDDREVLDSINVVATSQEKMNDILKQSPEKIYLYGEKFSIPFGKENVTYVGINNPVILLEKSVWDYKAKKICFEKTRFDEKSYEYAENLFITGKQKEAFPLIEQAANNGNPRAMYVMACYYNDGYNVVKINNKIRNSWCEKALKYKEPLSMFGYARWVLDRYEQKDTYDEITENGKKLEDLKNLGDVLAQCVLAYALSELTITNFSGIYFYPKNLYSEPAEKGFADAQFYFADVELSSWTPRKNSETAEWYRKAANQGHANAQYELGMMYNNGIDSWDNSGIPKDSTKAVEWLTKAGNQGLAEACSELGEIYLLKNQTKAKEWYKKAAEMGDGQACHALGMLSDDKNEAIKWYKKAVENGCSSAKEDLAYWGIYL